MKKNLIIWVVVFIALISIGLVIGLNGVVNKNDSTVNNNPATSDNQALTDEAIINSGNDNIAATSSETVVESVATDNSASEISGNNPVVEKTTASNPAQIANPASTNCLKLGGRLVTKNRGDGGEYSICYFDNNLACEEWALMRGDCPVGGAKNTGLDTIDQRYCAWAGGQTVAGPNPVCTFKDGSKCSTLDFFNGVCPK